MDKITIFFCSYAFESTNVNWDGPCLYLKASVGFATRDYQCDNDNAYICQWRGKTYQYYMHDLHK